MNLKEQNYAKKAECTSYNVRVTIYKNTKLSRPAKGCPNPWEVGAVMLSYSQMIHRLDKRDEDL